MTEVFRHILHMYIIQIVLFIMQNQMLVFGHMQMCSGLPPDCVWRIICRSSVELHIICSSGDQIQFNHIQGMCLNLCSVRLKHIKNIFSSYSKNHGSEKHGVLPVLLLIPHVPFRSFALSLDISKKRETIPSLSLLYLFCSAWNSPVPIQMALNCLTSSIETHIFHHV